MQETDEHVMSCFLLMAEIVSIGCGVFLISELSRTCNRNDNGKSRDMGQMGRSSKLDNNEDVYFRAICSAEDERV